MKKFFLTLPLLFALSVAAAPEKNDINGGFEKCRANAKGFVTPEGWVQNKISKGVKHSATTEEVRSGKFAFYAEAEEKSLAYVYFNQTHIKADAGDTLTFTVYGKGEGSFRLGATVYSDETKRRFIRTISAGKPQKISDGEKWQKFVFRCKLGKQKRSGKEYTAFQLHPTIIISGTGEFVLDDLSYELKKGNN